MVEDFEVSPGKSVGDLGREAVWFFLHTIFAILVLFLMVAAFSLFHPDQSSVGPKALATFLAFLLPMAVGLIVARMTNDIARYVWISGVLIFAIVCVWVLDLPTGPGLCEHCGALDKLYYTFFEFSNGSGLMGGDGVLVGTWIPLSLFGYAIGAKFGVES